MKATYAALFGLSLLVWLLSYNVDRFTSESDSFCAVLSLSPQNWTIHMKDDSSISDHRAKELLTSFLADNRFPAVRRQEEAMRVGSAVAGALAMVGWLRESRFKNR
jgi:hypothetical protein